MKKAFFVLFALSTFVSNAQTTLSSLQDALHLVEKNNPDYAIAYAQSDVKKADKFLAESAMMPQISGFASGDYNARLPVQPVPAEIFGGQPGTYKELRFGLPYNLNAGLDLTIPIIKANQWFDQRAAKAEWEKAQYDAEQQAETISLRATQAYFSLLAAQDLVKLNLAYLNTSKEVSRIATAKWEQGRVSEAEKIRAENLNLSAEMAYNNALLEKENALRSLELLLHTNNIQVQDSLSRYIAQPGINLPMVNERVSYIANERKIASLSMQSKARLADFFPSLSLSGRYAYYFQADNPFKASNGNITYDQALVGARLSVPIFGGAKNYARLKQSKTILKMGQWQLEAEKARLAKEHADIIAEQHTVQRNYDIALQRAQASGRAERLSFKRYDEGISGFTEYAELFYDQIRAEQENLQLAARLAYLNYVPTILKK